MSNWNESNPTRIMNAMGAKSGRLNIAGATAAVCVLCLLLGCNLRVDPIFGDTLPEKTVSLTYDDGPDLITEELALYLYSEGIKATFFFNGCRVEGGPTEIPTSPQPPSTAACQTSDVLPASLLDLLVSLGHRIGNHTVSHSDLTEIPDAEMREEVLLNQIFIQPWILDGLSLFRTPYGHWNQHTYDTLVQLAGLRQVIGTFDWEYKGDVGCSVNNRHPVDCANNVYLKAIGSNGRGMLLMHDRNTFVAGTDYTLQLTQTIVKSLRAQGYKFVPLDAIPGVMGSQSLLPSETWTAEFSDAAGWDNAEGYYGSLRLADINSDGRTDLCGRSRHGLLCATSHGSGFNSPTFWKTDDFRDVDGWLPEQYGATLQYGDLDDDGDADVCGRGRFGILCSLSNGTSAFGTLRRWTTDFSDEQGWDSNPSYWDSFALADVNGDGRADACGRGVHGIFCGLATADGTFAPVVLWTDDFSDEDGWLEERYGRTIRFGDVNGDGRADVCGRGTRRIYCGLARQTGIGFDPVSQWAGPGSYSDLDGWDEAPSKYRSIQLGDMDGDGLADLCGRNETGIVCAFSNGSSQFDRYHYVRNDNFRNDQGWNSVQYGSTLMLGDLDSNGGADVCARGVAGVRCALAGWSVASQ